MDIKHAKKINKKYIYTISTVDIFPYENMQKKRV